MPDNDTRAQNERVACQTFLKEYGGGLMKDPGKAHVILLGLLRCAIKSVGEIKRA